MKSIVKIWSLVLVVLMVLASCEPEMRENVTDAGNPSDISLLTQPFTLSMYSSQVSRILIAQYPDGSKKFVDGAIIGETGLFLQMDKDYPDRAKDTIWAKTGDIEGLVAEWNVEDESVLKIVETSQLPSYIVVEALKQGSTKISAKIEDKADTIIDVVVDSRYVKSLRYIVNGSPVESTSGVLYDRDVRAENDPEDRKDQYLLEAKVDAEENGGPVSFPVTWEIVGDVDTINDLKLTYIGENRESVMIETRKEGGKGLIERLNEGKDPASKDYIRSLDVTVKARVAYFSIDALLSIKPTNEIKKIESVEWRKLHHETEDTMDELEITTAESKLTPITLTAMGQPSVVDHLVGGYRFGIVGVDGSLNTEVVGSTLSNDIITLETIEDTNKDSNGKFIKATKEEGRVAIRGLKSGTVQIWVEIGDAALGGNFTVEEYGEPKRAVLTVNIKSAITGLKIYKDGDLSADMGTNAQTMTVGDEQVFVAQIEDAEAHEEFKGSIEWYVENNDNGAISIAQDPADPTRVTVTANSAAKGDAAPKIYAKAKDTKKEITSAMFRIDVEEAASNEASDLEFTSASVRWEDFYSFGSDYYTYVFTTAAGDELVIPASDPDMMGMGYNAYMFDEERTWTIGENGDEDIFIMSGPGIGITISASGTEYRIKSGTITISGGGTSASIDLLAVPVVGGVEGTATPVTGNWSGVKPADPRP